MQAKNLFIINVGANASHHGMVSPLYRNDDFDIITIPEYDADHGYACLRYCDVTWEDPIKVQTILGERIWTIPTHNDPDLGRGVYGDLPDSSPRAFSLRKAKHGDGMLFFARLTPFNEGRFSGEAGFYLIGGWVIDKILSKEELVRLPLCQRVLDNPHVRKLKVGKKDNFILYLAKEKSYRFEHPIRMDRGFLAEALPESNLWTWDSCRSSLQIIGSHLRTIKCVKSRSHRILTKLI